MYFMKKGSLCTLYEHEGEYISLVLIPASKVRVIRANLKLGLVYPICSYGILATQEQVDFIESFYMTED